MQGVGFRPFVYRLAGEHTLDGWVRNDERGVLLEVEGERGALQRFLARLAERVAAAGGDRAGERCAAGGDRRARLPDPRKRARWPSRGPGLARHGAPAATASRELFDRDDRRYRYPFINCTNCGPRFTIVRGVPYDRPRTTMAAFTQCAACLAEYEDPARQALPRPAERVSRVRARRAPHRRDGAHGRGGADPIAAAAAELAAGRILAVKGVGGYHLACRADDERAVAELRARKHRDEKPFALMVLDTAALGELVSLSAAELELLSARERPIVIARRRPGARVAAAVAPGLADLGVMLPSTPLHHLLLADAAATLVMTSGNVHDEPIAHEDDDALRRLGPIADALLVHDRAVHVRADDSVARSLPGRRPLLLRRSRGYVPASLGLPVPAPPLLACGAELKSTFCLAKGSRAWVGPHVGDLKNWETLRSFRAGIGHFEALFAVAPQTLVHDLHPDYLSTGYARQREGVELIGVQHHHAHFAAVLAEHGERGPAIGAIYDGAGLGEDGTIWGGELLAGGLERAQRAGHLYPVRLPGGDAAAREPWRMACAWLVAALDGEAPLPSRLVGSVQERRWEQVAALARSGLASPLTSSAGRLFDAVSALCGIRTSAREEGRAAAELETVAAPDERGAYPLALVQSEPLVLDPRETVRAIIADLAAGTSAALVSARFHNGLAEATARALALLAQRHDVRTAVLAGGVFQNRLLLTRCAEALAGRDLRLLIPRALPPNDGAIAYGQAAIAAARLAARGAAPRTPRRA